MAGLPPELLNDGSLPMAVNDDAALSLFAAPRGYGEAVAAAAIGQGLLDRGLGPDRPLLILSGNSVDHLLLELGASSGDHPEAERLSVLAGTEPGAAQQRAFAGLRPDGIAKFLFTSGSA
jgi:hypothetical protein